MNNDIHSDSCRKFLIYAGDELTQGNATFNPLKAFAACTKVDYLEIYSVI